MFPSNAFVTSFIPSHLSSFSSQIRFVEQRGVDTSQGELQLKKVLILLRGLPGSGKTTLAQVLREVLGACVCSADDYFVTSAGVYQYDQCKLSEAHEECQKKARQWISKGMQFVVIDNTNVTALDMEPYVRMAVKWDYEIILMEPNTQWKYDVPQLARRNVHRVPSSKIDQMKRRFEKEALVKQRFDLIRRQAMVTTDTGPRKNSNMTPSNSTPSLPPPPPPPGFGDLTPAASTDTPSQAGGDETDIQMLITLFPLLQVEQIHEMHTLTDGNREHTIELLKHVELSSPVNLVIQATHEPDPETQNGTTQSVAFYVEEEENLGKVRTPSVELDQRQGTTSSSCSLSSSSAPEMWSQASSESRHAIETTITPSGTSLMFNNATADEAQSGAPIPLTAEFLHDAQNRFGMELGLQQVDIDVLPAELLQNWRPPPHVARLVYVSFMASLGLAPSPSPPPVNPVTSSSAPLPMMGSTLWYPPPQSNSDVFHLHHLSGCASQPVLSTCAGATPPMNLESCLPFREIMDIDLALERSIQDQLPWLNQVSSRMKLRLLKEMFPAIEMPHLEALCVQFGFSTAALLDHLLSQGYCPRPTQGFNNAWSCSQENDTSGDARLAFILGQSLGAQTKDGGVEWQVQNMKEADMKERLEEERERRAYLQRKIQEAFSRKSLPGVAQFYQSELATSSRVIAALEQALSQQTVEARRVVEGVNRLDVHHLNVRNAMEQVKRRIDEIRASGGGPGGVRQSLTIITGRGVHSVGPARLRPAVKKFLQDNNYKFQELTDGHFIVNLVK